MDPNNYLVNSLKQEITEYHLQIKAIIQDINGCVNSLAELQNLNSEGRSKISALRKRVDELRTIAKENKDKELLKEVVLQRELLSSTMESFKKANISTMLAIEKSAKEELFRYKNGNVALRQRQKVDKNNFAKISSSVTDQLLSISRQLANTTKKSADTIDVLASSSDNVTGTQEELKVTSSTIGQSGKLLAKYGRREFTDKILMFFAFGFFVASVIYIVQKRLF